MCGILFVDAGGDEIERGRVEQAGARLRHRGPDASRSASVKDHALVFHRLAVIGTRDGGNGGEAGSSAGMQPFFTPDGRVALVCSGEVYNYAALLLSGGVQPVENARWDSLPALQAGDVVRKKPLTLATLHHWAMRDDPVAYAALRERFGYGEGGRVLVDFGADASSHMNDDGPMPCPKTAALLREWGGPLLAVLPDDAAFTVNAGGRVRFESGAVCGHFLQDESRAIFVDGESAPIPAGFVYGEYAVKDVTLSKVDKSLPAC